MSHELENTDKTRRIITAGFMTGISDIPRFTNVTRIVEVGTSTEQAIIDMYAQAAKQLSVSGYGAFLSSNIAMISGPVILPERIE